MAIDFPASPTVGQVYTFGGRTWKWNGEGWELQYAGSGVPYTITTTTVSKDLTPGELCVVTGTSVTLTLPASPPQGTQVAVGVTDNPTSLSTNGAILVGSSASPRALSVANSTYEFIYVNPTVGWIAFGRNPFLP